MARVTLVLSVLILVAPTGAISLIGLAGGGETGSAGGANGFEATRSLMSPTVAPATLTLGMGWTKVSASAGPSARSNASITFDPALGAVLLFGGWNGSYLSDTWQYRGGLWSPILTTTHPSARAGAALIFDPALEAAVLFGGTNGKALGDTWEFVGGLWTQLTVTPSPSARAGASAAFDPATGGVVLFGGKGTLFLSDTWLLSLTGWTLVHSSVHPAALAYASMVYDPSLGAIVLYGGASAAAVSATWEFTQGAWTKLSPAHPPPARSMAGMAYDGSDGFTLLFGGRNAANFGNTWEFDRGQWSSLSPTNHPTNRSAPAMAFDGADGYVLLFGGSGTSFLGDTWAYKIRTGTPAWNALSIASGPRQREQGVTAYDPVDGYTVLFGGWNSTATDPAKVFFNDTWSFAGGVWNQLHPGTAPSPRRGAMMVFDSSDGYLVLFGGSNGTGYLNDTWSFRAGSWTHLTGALAPPTRRSAAIAFDPADGYVVLFGGHNGSGVLPSTNTRYYLRGDTWTFRAGVWSAVASSVHPSARAEPEMDYDAADGYVLLFGGYVQHKNGFGDVEQADTWKFVGGAWSNLTLSLTVSPSPRDGESIVFDPTHGYLLMFGGDLGALAPKDSWSYRGGWTQICASCGTNYRPGSHATFDDADGYVVYLGGDQFAHGATVAWVAPLVVTPASPSPTDAGVPVAFRATVTQGIPPLRYLWTFGDGNVSSLSNPVESFPTGGTYLPRLTVTDSTGVSLGRIVSISVAPRPAVSAGANPSTTDVNGTVAFLAVPSGGTSPFTYQWSFGDGATSNSSAPSHLFASPGTFSGGVTVTDAIGVSAFWSFTEIVHGGPIPSIMLSRNVTDVGLPVAFSGSVVNGTGPFAYAWDFGNGSNDSGTNVTHAFGVAGLTRVTLTVTDTLGARSQTSISLDIHPVVQVNGSLPSLGEVGENLSFLAAISGGTGPFEADWNFGDNSSGHGTAVAHLFALPGTYNVSFLATDTLGMSSGQIGTVEIVSAPSVQAQSGSGTNLTIGVNATFNATVVGGIGPFLFQWTFGDGNSSNQSNATHAFAAAGTFIVQVTVSDMTGAQATGQVTVFVTAPRPRAIPGRRADPEGTDSDV